MQELKLPKTGQAMEEGTVTEWVLEEGDAVDAGNPVVLFESEKATSEITADENGVLLGVEVEAGETVPIGTTLGYVGSPDEADDLDAGATTDDETAAGPSAETDTDEADGVPEPAVRRVDADRDVYNPGLIRAPPSARRRANELDVTVDAVAAETGRARVTTADVEAFAAGDSPTGVEPVAGGRTDDGYGEVLASPLARKEASDEDVALAEVGEFVGRDRLRAADVDEFLAAATEPAEPATDAGGRIVAERVPIEGTRQIMFDRMQTVSSEYGSTTTIARVDVTELLDLYERLSESWDDHLSITAFVLRAVARNIGDYPELNAEVSDEALTTFEDVNLGIAVNTDDGLLVPTIYDADERTLRELGDAVASLAERAADGDLDYDEMQNGTFTVSNAGGLGAYINTPQINPPQTGVLGVCTVFDQPAVVDGDVVPRKMMHLSLTYDHRVVEGATAVTFLQSVKDALEAPASLLS